MNGIFEELKQLIEAEGQKEEECRFYLQYAQPFLFRDDFLKTVYVETDYIGNTGESDYVISAAVKGDQGTKRVEARIWELKAPQCYIFEYDNENRLKPTKELYDAENKLLHYFDLNRGTDQFREKFKTLHRDHVKLGGIIIGSDSRKVRGEYADDKKQTLFDVAYRIRNTFFYKDHIRLVTWDVIADQMKPPLAVGETRQSDVVLQISVPPAPAGVEIERS